MAFCLTSDMDCHKKLPAYKPLLKTILKSQIQLLVNQLSEYGDEECVLLSASLVDYSLSHIGSKYGHSFLNRHDDIESNFLNFCLEKKNESNPFSQSTVQLPGPTNQRKIKKRQKIMHGPKSKRYKQSQLQFVQRLSSNELSPNISANARQSENEITNITSEQNSKTDHQQESNVRSGNNIGLEEIIDYKVSLNDSYDDENIESHPNTENAIKIDDVIVKVEPNWGEQDDTTNTEDQLNMEKATNMEEKKKNNTEHVTSVKDSKGRDDKKSTMNIADKCDIEASSESSLNSTGVSSSSQCHSSRLKKAHLQPEFLCCNDDLIWEKNYQPKQKRTIKTASLWKKYSAIKEVELKKKSKAVIAKEFNVPSSTLSTWIKYAEQIKADVEENKIDPNKKKRRFSKFYDIETALLEWLKIVHMQGVIPKITSVNICDKANQLAKQFGYTEETFQCTKGWVERFKQRHGFDKNFVKGDTCIKD